MLHNINSTSLEDQLIMQNGSIATNVTAQQQSFGYIIEPSIPAFVNHPEPNIAYSGGATETILAVAVLIRSVAFLIQVIAVLRKPKSEPKADS